MNLKTTFLTRIVSVLLTFLIPLNLWMSFHPGAKIDPNVKEVLEKTGGFMKGCCHTNQDYDLLEGANIEWTRKDIPFPYNKDGSLSEYYLSWKKEMKQYHDNGIKVFAITPYPHDYIDYGLDPRKPENRAAIQKIAKFYVKDLAGIVGAFQITNEMGIDRFTLPLTLEEAVDFIAMHAEVMYKETRNSNVIIGYNIANPTVAIKMLKYSKWIDYIGLDLYIGCFEEFVHDINLFPVLLGIIRGVSQKPLILCEFGYIGYGEALSKSEKKELINSYGFKSETDAIENMDEFLDELPPDMSNEIEELYPDATDEELGEMIFKGEYANHFYKSLPKNCKLYGYDHTPEGQAKFYRNLIPKLRKLDYLCGAFVYCWADSSHCYVCGQAECPVETGWGLIDGKGNPKPAYYAVRDGFSDAKKSPIQAAADKINDSIADLNAKRVELVDRIRDKFENFGIFAKPAKFNK